MLNLSVDVDSLTSAGRRVLAAAEAASMPAGAAVTPMAADPVSVGAAAALQAWAMGIAAYSAAGSAITAARGQQLLSSAATYADQEAANASLLAGSGGGGGGGFTPGSAPSPIPLPMVPPVSPPVFGAPPGTGREIAELLHAGPGPGALRNAAQQLRSHAGQLGQTAEGVNGAAAQVSADWPSESGLHAAHRLGELGSWFEDHADQARTLSAAIDDHVDSFARAKATIPTPEQFHEVENRLVAAAAANANPANMGRYTPVVAALQAQLAQMNAHAQAAYCGTYATESSRLTGTTLQPRPQPQGAPTPPREGSGIVQVSMSEGAGAGPHAGPGVPPSIVGGNPAIQQPIYPLNPTGAMPGSGVTGGSAPVSYTSAPEGLVGGDLFGDDIEEPVPVVGAGPGPNVGPGVPSSIVGSPRPLI